MAVSALELRPRRAIALVDAAVRLCVSVPQAWTLGLWSGGMVTAAALGWIRAVQLRQDLGLWSLAVALAWTGRAVLQGALCELLDRAVLAAQPPSLRGALRMAVRQAPALVLTAGVVLAINLLSLPLTLGLAVLFLSNHLPAYAVTVRGGAHPLGIYGACSRLLGPARGQASWVRLSLWWWPLAAITLHVCVKLLLTTGEELLALDLAYARHFTALTHGPWLALLCGTVFTLLEPMRAALAVLLLVDGRVRMEGLDLRAQIEQLPSRRRASEPLPKVAGLLLLVALALPGAAPAAGQAEHSAMAQRLRAVATRCELELPILDQALLGLDQLAPADQSALGRFVSELETTVDEYEDCDAAQARLEAGLPLIIAEESHHPPVLEEPAARARAILSRPEFAVPAQPPPVPKAQPAPPPDWWTRLLDWLKRVLKELFKPRAPVAQERPSLGSGSVGALVAALVVIVGVVGVLAFLLASAGRKDRRTAPQLETEGLSDEPGPAGALPDARSRTTEAWAGDADALAARGLFREAVRSLYLALLSRLHRDGAIDYDPAHSNWDYLRHFRGEGSLRGAFRELTLRFDHAFYGRAEVGPDGYQTFRSLCAPLLVGALPGGAGPSPSARGEAARA